MFCWGGGETTSFGVLHIRFAKIAPGYYTIQTLKLAIQEAFNSRFLCNYIVGY